MLRNLSRWKRFVAAMAFAVMASAQGRINDKDLAKLMKNLSADAKAFRGPFKSAIKKSTIRGTSQAKEADQLADRFAKQTEGLVKNFERTKKGDQALAVVQDSGRRLDEFVRQYASEPKMQDRWGKISTELNQVASAYGEGPAGYR